MHRIHNKQLELQYSNLNKSTGSLQGSFCSTKTCTLGNAVFGTPHFGRDWCRYNSTVGVY